jgi:hypothetical protein
MEFDKLVFSILPLIKDRNQVHGELASMDAKLREVQLKYKKLECNLKEYSERATRVAV